MQIKILGSGKEVGRAAISVEYNNRSVLLDYGVNFDENDNPVMPLHISPIKLDGVVLSHVHLDHIGAAPLLYSSVKPKAFSTRVTRHLARLMLEDFLKLSGYYLDFEINEVNSLLSSIQDVKAGDFVKLSEFFSLDFYHSGHIPGSLSVKISTPDGSLIYTADINSIDTKLVESAKIDGAEADVLIIESTYGNANHPERKDVEKRLTESVNEVLEKGGTVLIPVFSVGRGQEIMTILAENDVSPVYIDGMVKQATEIMLENKVFLKNSELLEKAYSEQIFLKGWQDRRKVWKKPCVIVSSSGMLKGGPSRYYLRKIADDEKNAVFLVSFQGKNTPGRSIIERGIYEDGGKPVKARVEWMDFSSHAGKNGLIEIIKSIRNLEKIILVHGEPESQNVLADEIKQQTGIVPVIPNTGEVISFSKKH
ncbi:MAG: MBL fold metallo-hydrolase [Fervidicoccus fontis]